MANFAVTACMLHSSGASYVKQRAGKGSRRYCDDNPVLVDTNY